LAGPSGSANRVVFPPLLRFSIVKARAEGMAQALMAQETAIATAAQRRRVDPIIAILPGEPAYFLEPFVWPQKLFSSRAVRFSEGVAAQPRGVARSSLARAARGWDRSCSSAACPGPGVLNDGITNDPLMASAITLRAMPDSTAL
jgi:hypothetical protein